VGTFEHGAVAENLAKCQTDAENAQADDKWRLISAACCDPVGGQMRAKFQGCGLENKQGSEKTNMTPEEARKLAADGGTT